MFFVGNFRRPLLRNSWRHQASLTREGEKSWTTESSGKFYINHYKLDSVRCGFGSFKNRSPGVWKHILACHSFLIWDCTGKSWLGIWFVLPIRRRLPGTSSFWACSSLSKSVPVHLFIFRKSQSWSPGLPLLISVGQRSPFWDLLEVLDLKYTLASLVPWLLCRITRMFPACRLLLLLL